MVAPADIAAANRASRNPTEELHSAISALHAAIAVEPEAEDKARLTAALNTLMAVQAKNAKDDMAKGSGGQ